MFFLSRSQEVELKLDILKILSPIYRNKRYLTEMQQGSKWGLFLFFKLGQVLYFMSVSLSNDLLSSLVISGAILWFMIWNNSNASYKKT